MKSKLLLLVIVLALAVPASAATRNWTNTLGGNWFVAANWSPNGVPTFIDTANITNNGTYTVNILTGAVSVATLNLGGASGTQTLLNGTATALAVTNAGAVRANGILSITNGGLQGNVVIQPSGQLQLAGSSTKAMYWLTLINQGTVTWSGGNLQGGSTPTTIISNGGLWQITSDNVFSNPFGGPPTMWTNSGTIRKSAGSGTTQINDFNLFNQPSGVIDTLSGTLSFSGGTNSVLGGSLSATSPGLMTIAGGTWTDAGGTASGTGTNRFHGGTLNLRTNIIPGLLLTGGEIFVTGTTTFQQAGAITSLTLDGSRLKGTNRIGNGNLTINVGAVDGQLTVQPGGQLVLATAATKQLHWLTLINQGTVTWSGGNIQGGSTPTTIVSNGGLWQVTGDYVFSNPFGGPPMMWTNSGTLRKSAGSGTSQINDFNLLNQPAGVIDTLAGTLYFNGGTNSILGGSLTATTPGIMNIAGGTWTDAGGTASGTGTNRFNGGTLNLRTNIIPGLLLTGGEIFVTGTTTFQQAGAITNLTLDGSRLKGTNRIGSGALTINVGAVDGQLTVQPAGQLLLATPATKQLNWLTLINQGTVTWSGGNLQGGSTPTTIVSNGGLWQVTGDYVFSNPFGGPPMMWTNTGTLRKSAGSGTSQINDFNLWNQPSGVIDTLAGTLYFNGGTNSILGGSLTAAAPGIMNIAGGTWTDAAGSASGTGINRFNGGTLNLRTNIIPGLLLTGGEVFVTGPSTFQQAGAITNLTLDGARLKGSNRVGNGVLLINSGAVDGQLLVQPGGELQLATAATKALYWLTLINQGTVTWSGGNLQGGSTPTTIVSNGGLWQVTGDYVFSNPFGGPPMMWTNTGTIRKSAGTGTSQINDFNLLNQPAGVIDTLAGTLYFNGGTNSILDGSLTATTPGIMNIAGGTWTDAGGTASGTGTNRFNGGTLNLRTNIIPGLLLTGGEIFVTGTNTFQQAGAITNLTLDGSRLKGTNRVGNGLLLVNSGAVDGQLLIQPGGELQLATAATKALYWLTLINQGTVTWSGGNIQGGSTPTTIISNGGLWQITGDYVFSNPFGGPQMTWTNTGTVRKSAGSGTSQVNDFRFANQASGLIQADTGILQLSTPITNSAGTLRLNGGTIQSGGTYGITGGSLEGAGAFGANAINGGIVSPGQAGPGLIGFKSGLNFGTGATLTLAGTGTIPGTQYDQLSVTGAVALANATLQVNSLPSVAPGTTFVLILNDGVDAVTGTFSGLPENALVPVGAQPFRIHYAGGSGNDVTLVRDSGTITLGPLLTTGNYTGGTFQLSGAGSNGLVYTVQATTNFIQWTNLGFATGGVSGTFTFPDTNAFRYRYRFYRTTN
jgi:hypothetical protein